MTQKIYTKRFGTIEVERSWQDGTFHIAKLINGAYSHINGLPIKNEDELKAVLSGPDLEDALEWFTHRHEREEEAPRRIMFEADGTPLFEDGTPVESPSDLINSLKPGPLLDAALIALARKMDQRKEVRAFQETKAGAVAQELAGKQPKARPVKGPGGKLRRPTPAPVSEPIRDSVVA